MSSSQRQTVTGFIALAVLAGPVVNFVYGSIGFGAQYLSLIQMAFGSGLAGIALLLPALVRRERTPRGAELLAVVALVVPQWLVGLLSPPTIRAVPVLHETPWGVAFLVGLAAPLWLGLLAALRLINDEEVPRRVAAASIAGIGAVCLVIPVNAYTIALPQIPVAVLHVLLGLLTVFSWSYARPRLAAVGTAAAAGCYLLLNGAGSAGASLLSARGAWQPLDWRAAILPLAIVPLLLTIVLSAVTWWLWFWLLQRMTLAAFGMRTLALWTAAALPGFAMSGFLSWRIDAAIAISVAALVVALRARPGEEQPLALGLGDR